MKTYIFILALLISFTSCSGSKSGGKDPDLLSADLSSGSGTWELNYVENGTSVIETLVFAGDECQYKKVFDFPGNPTTAYDKRINVTPFGLSRMVGVNLADTSEYWTWDYSFSGNTLHLCDLSNNCYDFIKQ